MVAELVEAKSVQICEKLSEKHEKFKQKLGRTNETNS